ncbi:MAG: exodeoxyribonuclease VII large subunit, partial [Muribaculaceae bacterium]|nr:exodeoxyribonuclease VII large subunit [Muribaculaceae bacterium]
VSVSYHAVFGLTLTISSVNPEYTMGDLMKRRKEILQRLEKEGILELNRQLKWPEPVQRIAVISAPGAAGYGDFINQLYHNPRRLRFSCRLFPATMQGDRTVPSIIAALNQIEAEYGQWDCVVMIRGGGASSDLAAFDDYELASSIARCNVPVIIGIGHERDVTVLDHVANMRVKTPTAAAEWLIKSNAELLDRLRSTVTDILQVANDRIAGFRAHAAYLGGLIPALSSGYLAKERERLSTRSIILESISSRRIAPAISRLDNMSATLTTSVRSIIDRNRIKLQNCESLTEALSPEATLRRGYTITRANGSIVTSASQVPNGTTIITITANGSISSTVNSPKQ